MGKESKLRLYNAQRIMDNVSTTGSNNERLLSVTEFAAAIGKTERQVYRYVSQGRIVPQEGGGRGGIRIPESEVATFLANNNNNSASGSWGRIRNRRSREDNFESSLENVSLSASDAEQAIGRNADEEGKVKSFTQKDGTVGTGRTDASGEGASPVSFEYVDSSDDLEEQLADDSDDTDEVVSDSGATFPTSVPLERHEAAVMRLGYMQSQLEQVQRLLTDGTQKDKEKDEKLQTMMKDLDEAQREILRLGAKIEAANENRKEAEMRANHLAVKLEAAERLANLPWWKRIFL
ncbi:MAG: helix-turn-helix domain-containing protein [Candidatus Bruticola sp.]